MGMILDCRRPNLWFKRPPRVQLVTGEGLANLEVETAETSDDAGLWLGQADVKDAFHPGCMAEEMSMVGETVDGVKLRAGDVVYPLARSLPVGFAWSL